MPEIKKLSLGQDNYPKASPVRSSKRVTSVSTASVQSSPQPSVPRDTFQNGYHDPQADQMNELRRRAAARIQPSRNAALPVEVPRQGHLKTQPTPVSPVRTAPIVVDPGYPQATAKPGHASPVKSQGAPAKAQPSHASTTRTAPIEVDLKYPQAAVKSGHGYAQSRPAPRNTNSAHVASPVSSGVPKQKHAAQLAVLHAHKKKFDAQMEAQTGPQTRTVEAPEVKAKPQVKKSHSSGGGKKAVGGAFTTVSGALTMKNGMKNLANGNYLEGGLQLTQGGLSVADGVKDMNLARKGLSGAPVGKVATRLKVAGGVMNAGMAAHDTKQAYNAFKSGNEVEGAEKASSAVINAISAFPPTAVIGAVGGVADWAMAASGADDAMVRALTSGKDQAYQKQVEKDMQLAKVLVKTPTATLARCNREQKQAYIRGLQGLKEYRQHFASQGNSRAVEDIDAHIARIKGAWSK